MPLSRRGLLRGFGLALAAPAIIRSPGLLMPIKPIEPVRYTHMVEFYRVNYEIMSPTADELASISPATLLEIDEALRKSWDTVAFRQFQTGVKPIGQYS